MTLVTRVLQGLARAGWTLAAAESVTGGLFAAQLTREPGASERFVGGIVVYTDAAKRALAGVDGALLAKEGGVSAPVARDLARATRERLEADLALSIVGFAGPSVPKGGELGKVFIALAHADGVETHELHLPGERAQVREAAVDEALRLVLARIESATPR